MVEYKPFKSIDEQLSLLSDRGLIIDDPTYAKHILTHYNYYRLSGYTLTLRKKDKFYPGITFNDIMQIYNFDYDFKYMLLSMLEHIEISLRTHIAYVLGQQDKNINHGTVSYLNKANYASAVHFEQMQPEFRSARADNRNEAFIKHHNTKYNGVLPVWVFVETLSFGTLSRLFASLDVAIKKEICDEYYKGIRYTYIENWLQALVVLRNLCAHHSRVYNRGLSSVPKFSSHDLERLKSFGYQANEIGKKVFFALLIMDRIFDDNNITKKIINNMDKLTQTYPFVNLKHYGFKSNWKYILADLNKDYK